ncbi:MAG: hypothetical protein EOO24_25190 [Comamonadaceae bacterium]|nr:MAG: hypothetical protein EOO24_25190 [Comamonadaceae bacterium]
MDQSFKVILRGLALAATTGAALVAQAQTVTPPPLPPGSALVRLDPGMSDAERKRHVRAHHHKFHHGKDVTRDDSVHGHESEVAYGAAPGQQGVGAAGAPGAGPSAARPGAGAVQDGRGTGPARQQTDRGASSWFYGQPDKK